MLDTWEDLVIVVLIVLCSLLFKVVIDRLWTREHRRTHNDLIGWQLSILGTTYAVIVGFMLYTVWTNFGLAEVNADSEANALVNVYRLAEGLPATQRDELKLGGPGIRGCGAQPGLATDGARRRRTDGEPQLSTAGCGRFSCQ